MCAEAACRAEAIDPRAASLLLVAHGNANDAMASATALGLVRLLGRLGRFAAIGAAFLEEPPHVAAALGELGDGPVVALGLFAAPAEHAMVDVPALIADAAGHHRGPVLDAGPVGAEPGMARLILDRVRAHDRGDSNTCR